MNEPLRNHKGQYAEEKWLQWKWRLISTWTAYQLARLLWIFTRIVLPVGALYVLFVLLRNLSFRGNEVNAVLPLQPIAFAGTIAPG